MQFQAPLGRFWFRTLNCGALECIYNTVLSIPLVVLASKGFFLVLRSVCILHFLRGSYFLFFSSGARKCIFSRLQGRSFRFCIIHLCSLGFFGVFKEELVNECVKRMTCFEKNFDALDTFSSLQDLKVWSNDFWAGCCLSSMKLLQQLSSNFFEKRFVAAEFFVECLCYQVLEF